MAQHQITIEGKTYDLALSLGDIRKFREKTGKDFMSTVWNDAEALAALAALSIRPRGVLNAQQIDDGVDAAGVDSLMEFALATTEQMARPAVARSQNPLT